MEELTSKSQSVNCKPKTDNKNKGSDKMAKFKSHWEKYEEYLDLRLKEKDEDLGQQKMNSHLPTKNLPNEHYNKLNTYIREAAEKDREKAILQCEKNMAHILQKDGDSDLDRSSTKEMTNGYERKSPNIECIMTEALKKSAIDEITCQNIITILSTTDKEMFSRKAREFGDECMKNSDYVKSWLHYSICINIRPTVSAYNNRAQICLKLNWNKLAIENCNSALDLDPKYAKALHQRGTAYNNINMLEKAAIDFRSVLRINRTNKEAQRLLADIESKTKLIKELSSTEKAPKMNNRFARLNRPRKKGSPYNNQYDKIPDSDLVHSDNSIATKWLAKAFLEFGKSNFQAANDYFTSSINANPDNKVAYSSRATARLKLSEPDIKGALEDINKSVEVDNHSTESIFERGLIHSKLNMFQEAVTDFKTVLEREPNHTDALSFIQISYRALVADNKYHGVLIENPYESFDEYIAALANMPRSERMSRSQQHLEKGNEELREKSYYEAWEAYSFGIEAFPTVVLYNNRAQACLGLKWYEWAVEDCTKALELDPHQITSLMRRGMAYKSLEIVDKAANDFREVLKIHSKHTAAQELLKWCCQNDHKENKEIEEEKELNICDNGQEENKENYVNGCQDNDSDDEHQVTRNISDNEQHITVCDNSQQKDFSDDEEDEKIENVLTSEQISEIEQLFRDCENAKVLHENLCSTGLLQCLPLELKNKLSKMLFHLGRHYFADENNTETINISNLCIDLVSNKTDLIEVFTMKVGAKMKLLDYEGVIEDLDNILELNPKSLFGYYCRGNVYQRLHMYPEAIDDAEELLKLDPDKKKVHQILMILYSNYEMDQKYRGIKDQSVMEHPYLLEKRELESKHREKVSKMSKCDKMRTAKQYVEQGNDSLKKGMYYDAWLYYDMSIDAYPTVDAYNNSAETCFELSWYRWVIDDCNEALKIEQVNIISFLRRGCAYNMMGLFNKAMADFEKVMELDPSNNEAEKLMVEIESTNHISRNKLKTAEELANDWKLVASTKARRMEVELLRSDCLSSEIENVKRELYEDGALTSAQTEIIKLFEENRNPLVLYDKLSISGLLTNMSSLEKTVLSRKLVMLGSNLRDAGKNTDAFNISCTCINVLPSVDAYALRARSKITMHNYEGAVEDFSKALEIDPKDVDVLTARSKAYQNLNLYQNAINDIEEILKLEADPDRDSDRETLKDLYNNYAMDRKYHDDTQCVANPYEAEDKIEMMNWYAKVTEMADEQKKKFSETLQQQAHFCLQKGAFYHAWAFSDRSIFAFPTVEAYNNRAEACLALRWYRWAVNDCNKVLETEPNNADTLLLRGKAYYNMKLYDKAVIEFEKVLELDSNNKDAVTFLEDINHKNQLLIVDQLKVESAEDIPTDSTKETACSPTINYKVLKKKKMKHKNTEDKQTESKEEKVVPTKPKSKKKKKKNPANSNTPTSMEVDNMSQASSTNKCQSDQNENTHISQSTEEIQTMKLTRKEKAAEEEINKGDESYIGGDFLDAVTHYHQSIKIKPSAAGFCKRGFALVKLESCKLAIDDYIKALEMEPDYTKAYIGRGILYRKMGLIQEAVNDFKEAVKLDPLNSESEEILELLKEKLNNTSENNN